MTKIIAKKWDCEFWNLNCLKLVNSFEKQDNATPSKCTVTHALTDNQKQKAHVETYKTVSFKSWSKQHCCINKEVKHLEICQKMYEEKQIVYLDILKWIMHNGS